MDSLKIHRNLTNAPTHGSCAEIAQAAVWLFWVVVYLRFLKTVLFLHPSEMLLELEPEMSSGHFFFFALSRLLFKLTFPVVKSV